MNMTERELYELIGRLVVNGQLKDEPKKYLLNAIKVRPYECVRNNSHEHPIFEPGTLTGDAWQIFFRMAKLLHKPSPKFYMTTAKCDGRPYITYDKYPNAPKHVTDLTIGQQKLSLEMLNEMIPIWNKYFAKAHKSVWYDAKGNGSFQEVKVLYRESE